ncbi:hypothetical protein BWR17_19665 (plasmid) [Phaeobacter inhibens]|nr:hypothetical protein BWR17_19665 [Phaeobacter inhibens]
MPLGQLASVRGGSSEFLFVLLPGFSMLSLTAALETLQNANAAAGLPVYTWILCGLDGRPVPSSIGVEMPVDVSLKDSRPDHEIVIVSDLSVEKLNIDALCVWLARHARGQVRVTGIGTGAYILARAGVLGSAPVTIHWQYRDMFRETFPCSALSHRVQHSDGCRCSSSGGVSSIDLLLDLIEQTHGKSFSNSVAEMMNYSTIRELQTTLRADVPMSARISHPKVATALAAMEQNIEYPLALVELARRAAVSIRQLERLFRKNLEITPRQAYMRLRLQRAYLLLIQTAIGLPEIALACGFQTTGHFYKCFRVEYGASPTQIRTGRQG